MIEFSLAAVAGLVVLAHVAARCRPKGAPLVFVLGPGTAVLYTACGGFVHPSALGLAVLLAIALAVWPMVRDRVRWFLPLSAAAVALSVGWAAWSMKERYKATVALREQYPFESLADRVPEPRQRGDGLVGEAADRFNEFDRASGQRTDRQYLLHRLHTVTVRQFVETPGFGVGRVIRPKNPTETNLKESTPHGDPPPQPVPPGSPWLADEPVGPVAAADRAAFDGLHLDGLLDFVRPSGWGYFKSRREVAGFLPHAFSRVPEAKRWRVESIELVGVLKHPEPVAYRTERLPAMADLAAVPTRPLDAFEAAGLDAIRAGDDGHAGRRGDEVRFVGAVRAGLACVDCHGGTRGDLLGAFSYRLRPAGP